MAIDNNEYNNIAPKHANVQDPAFEAYSSLKAEFDSTSCAYRERRSVTLPDSEYDKLSVVWLNEQRQSLGRDITRSDLDQRLFDNQFDQLMAQRASEQFDTIKNAKWDRDGLFSKERDVISSRDIDKTLRNIEDQRQSMQYVEPLLANGGALFQSLAKVHNGELSISYWDLKDAIKADNKAQSRGDHIYSREDRQAMDLMYDRWSHSHMRSIEEAPGKNGPHAGSNMGCDYSITLESLRKGTGFKSVTEMVATFGNIEGLQPMTVDPCLKVRQHQIVQEGAEMFHKRDQQLQDQMFTTVGKGDGPDRIAQRTMKQELGHDPSDKSVIDYSKQIAEMNGRTRETYQPHGKNAFQPGEKIQVHDQEWYLMNRLDAGADALGWIEDQLKQK